MNLRVMEVRIMEDNYDFSKGVKNPYAAMMKNGYSIIVHYRAEDLEDEKMLEEDEPNIIPPSNKA